MLLKLLQDINRKRFEPSVVCLTGQGPVGMQITELDIAVHVLNMRAATPSPAKLWQLRNLIKSINPDIVQTWMYHADLLGGISARLAGKQKIVWGIRNSNLDAKLVKRSTRWVAQACAALSGWLPKRILCCSWQAKDAHIALGYEASKFEVIANGFSLERFRPNTSARQTVRTSLAITFDAPLVGLIARFDPLKNHTGFLQVARQVRDKVPSAHFLLAGDGIDHSNAALCDRIEALKLQQCVHLLGRRGDMPSLMAALDLLVSTSHGEAFPNVLGEAMACGVPCVVTDAGDSAEIVGDTGRVVSIGDMEELANKVLQLLKMSVEDRHTLGRQARARIQAHYEIAKIVKQYESFYEGVASV